MRPWEWSSTGVVFEVTERQGRGCSLHTFRTTSTGLDPPKPPDSQVWEGDIHLARYRFAKRAIWECSTEAFFTSSAGMEQGVLTKYNSQNLRAGTCDSLYYPQFVTGIASAARVVEAFHSNGIVPEVVARGSSNAAWPRAVRPSHYRWDLFCYVELWVEPKEEAIYVYFCMQSTLEWRSIWTLGMIKWMYISHALQPMSFICFMIITLFVCVVWSASGSQVVTQTMCRGRCV